MRLLALFAVIALAFWLLPQAWPFWLFAFMLSPGMCCCQTCSVVTDDFASNNLATNWTYDTAGSWSISGSQLTTGSTNARLINNASHPAGGFMRVTATLTPAASDEILIYGAYKDSSNYVAAKFVFGSPSGVTASLIQNGSSLISRTTSLTLGTSRTFALCISPDGGYASVTIDGSVIGAGVNYPLSTFASGQTMGGVGTGGHASSIAFTSFEIDRTDNSCPACTFACGICDTTGMAAEYLVTLSGITDGTAPSHCSNCAAYNSAFVCSYLLSITTSQTGTCSLQYVGPTFRPCGPTNFPEEGDVTNGSLAFSFQGVSPNAVAKVTSAGFNYPFKATTLNLSEPVDCLLGGTSLSIPPDTTGFNATNLCQIGSATCTVQALI